MNDHALQHEQDGHAFRRKLVWLAVIKVVVLLLTGLIIAYYVL